MISPVIEINDLWKAFGNNQVLKSFSMDLFPAENVAVMGKSGSGKSVLIKCVIGLIPIEKGMLKVLGREVPKLSRKELESLRKEIGFQFQGSALYDSMTVRENLEFPLRRHLKSPQKAELDHRVRESLEQVRLPHAIELMPSELSGGMKKRVALARALIMKPRIILYDEPTSGLDPVTGKEISLLINEIQNQNGTAAIIITHDIGCAKLTSKRMIILHDGYNYAEGTYKELSHSNDMHVKGFFS